MKFSKLHFHRDPNIGLFSFATDKFCLVNRFAMKKDVDLLKKVLKVPVYQTSVLGTGLIGIFAAGNSKGIVISDRIYHEEIEEMQRNFEVLVLETKHTAFGNLILANDNGCIVSSDLEKVQEGYPRLSRGRYKSRDHWRNGSCRIVGGLQVERLSCPQGNNG